MKKHAALILTAIAIAAAALAWIRSGEVATLKSEFADLVRDREHTASRPAAQAAAIAKAPPASPDSALEEYVAALQVIQKTPGDLKSPDKKMALTKWLAGAVA